MKPLRLGTRGSPLALWQANYVANLLRPISSPRPVDLVLIETHGDQVTDRPLSALGGFGVFTKAIQDALIADKVDVAVHSLKDLPTIPIEELKLVATPPRAPKTDAFISHRHARFDDLPHGAVVGTSSLRRRAQILNRRPDLTLVDLRGNIDTRLRKLRDQEMDAIVLARAGLERLGLGDVICEDLDPSWMLPAVGQGAIGLECRRHDTETIAIVEAINDLNTWRMILAERAMLWSLGGGCLVPIGADAGLRNGMLSLRGAVLTGGGERKIVDTHDGPAERPLGVGNELAAKLMSAGARDLLNGSEH